jgi:hypothetical protein
MNFFKKAFTTQAYQFKAAVKAQDATEVGRLLDMVSVPFGEAEMIVLAEQGGAEVLSTYFQKTENKGGWGWLFPPINHCLTDGTLLDRVDVMLEAGINFNREEYQNHPITSLILFCPADRERRLEWLEKMTAGGIEKIADREKFLKLAASCYFIEAVDLFVRLGLDPHTDYEAALCKAALCQNDAMCRHLIEKHGADIERAIMITSERTNLIDLSTDEMNDELKTLVFLRELQSTLKQPAARKKPVEEAKPATIETLSEDMKKLHEMVAELTQKVAQMQNPVVRLEKNSHSTPRP